MSIITWLEFRNFTVFLSQLVVNGCSVWTFTIQQNLKWTMIKNQWKILTQLSTCTQLIKLLFTFVISKLYIIFKNFSISSSVLSRIFFLSQNVNQYLNLALSIIKVSIHLEMHTCHVIQTDHWHVFVDTPFFLTWDWVSEFLTLAARLRQAECMLLEARVTSFLTWDKSRSVAVFRSPKDRRKATTCLQRVRSRPCSALKYSLKD